MINNLKRLYVRCINAIASCSMPDDFSNDLNSVLIIRLDELGDFILWLDSSKEYRNIYPKRTITLLVNEKWYSLAKTFDYWDEVIGINTDKFKFHPIYRLKMLVFIRKQGFHTAISPRYFTQYLLEPAIINMSGAEERIVHGGHYPMEEYFTKLVNTGNDTLHELVRNGNFLRELGVKDFKARLPQLPKPIKRAIKYIVICPTAYRKQKEWARGRYLELMARIALKTQINVVVVSNVKFPDPLPDGILDFSGKTTVLELINIIGNANLVISNDSAPIHIATALGVPSVCFGIGRHGAMFLPYPEELEGIKPVGIFNPKVKEITVDEAWDIVKDMI